MVALEAASIIDAWYRLGRGFQCELFEILGSKVVLSYMLLYASRNIRSCRSVGINMEGARRRRLKVPRCQKSVTVEATLEIC